MDILWHSDDIDWSRPLSDQSPDQGEGPSAPWVTLLLNLVNSVTANISQEGGCQTHLLPPKCHHPVIGWS